MGKPQRRGKTCESSGHLWSKSYRPVPNEPELNFRTCLRCKVIEWLTSDEYVARDASKGRRQW